MAVPTQVLPSWMTLSSAIITEPDGSIFTSYTTLELPLTYYGPSIPLDPNWTYGGFTPPPTTTSTSPMSSPTPSSSLPSSISTPSVTSTSLSSSTLTSSLPHSSTSTSSASASATSSAAAAASHGPRPATVIGAILGSLLGTLLLIVLILIWLLLRRHKRGAQGAADTPAKSSSSSFWNRSATVFTRRKSRRQTPIWTEWQIVNPEDLDEEAPMSPGEGTPRDSGDEADPFLNRSIRSGTNEMMQTQTGTETLVSLPAAAALAAGTASTHRSATTTHVGGPIMPRGELLARMNEEDAATPQIRLVGHSSEDDHTSPLLPPPPLSSDRRSIRGARPPLNETKSTRSLASAALSASSEKSGSIDVLDQAELLTARRVKVGQSSPEVVRSSLAGSTSGLERLANLPRMSWFRRMSFLPAPAHSRSGSSGGADVDRYTRTPPRSHSRHGSRSRPVSWAPLPTQEPASPTPDSSASRRPRPPSSFPQGLGLLVEGERPVSSVSAKSRASGSTVYHDARETPSSSMVDVSATPGGTFGSNRSQPAIPPVPSLSQSRSAPVSPLAEQPPTMSTRGGYLDVPGEPPSYEESHHDSPQSDSDQHSDQRAPSVVDVLDLPVPRPASPFSAASGSSRLHVPPGLPNPNVWRDSHTTTDATASASGIHIDVLEEAPPPAQEGWRTLAGTATSVPGGDGNRRTTFGVPLVTHPPNVLHSERGSLTSMRSHLSPHALMHSAGSAPASSLHTQHSSSSKAHSQGPSGSSGAQSLSYSGSVSEDDRRSRRVAVGEAGEPPVSAVFARDGVWGRPLSPPAVRPMSPIRQSPSSSAEGAPTFPEPHLATPTTVAGTVTSTNTSRTADSGAHASVTTTGTDPVSGVVLHFPALPCRHPSEPEWGPRRDDDLMW